MPFTVNKAKQIFIPLLKILVAIFSCWYVLHHLYQQKDAFRPMYDVFSSNSFFMLFVVTFGVVMCSLGNWYVEFKKWQLLVREVQPIMLKTAAVQCLIAHAASILTPNKTGEFVFKPLFFDKLHQKRIAGLAMWNNFSQLSITVFFGLLGLFLLPFEVVFKTISSIQYYYLIGFVFTLIAVVMMFKQQLLKLWHNYKANFQLKNEKINLLLLWSLFKYALFSHQYFLIGYLLGWNIDYLTTMPILFLMYFLSAVLPSIFILDAVVKAGVAIYLFEFVAVSPILILSISATMWLLNFAFPALLGSLLMVVFKHQKRNTSMQIPLP